MATNKRKCKQCGEVFEKKQPLQFICTPVCAINYAKKKEKVKWQKEKKQRLIDLESLTGVQSKYIQPKVNELVRIIDNGLPCIASGTFGKQAAGHYYHAGGNPQIRFNLHNIHIQSFHSNSALAGDVLRYREGVKRVYGLDYLEFMDSLTQTPTIKRTKDFYLELNKKLIAVKKWLKVQVNGQMQDVASRIRLRNEVNLLLGIYDRQYCIFT